MEALVYFAIWAGIFFLMMRFGCGAHIMGHDNREEGGEPKDAGGASLRWMPPKSDIDPVCNKSVNPEKAKSAVYDGNVFYFCSRECREVFEAAPDQYVGGGEAHRPNLEHSHA
jgi:YHS domain-containing protein